MYRSDESALVAVMPSIPFAPVAREGSRSSAAARSATTRPVLSIAAFRAGRQSRALQLSWVGLVRR